MLLEEGKGIQGLWCEQGQKGNRKLLVVKLNQ